MAQKNIKNANEINTEDINSDLVEINVSSAIQGAEWSVGEKYLKGQIVFHNGVYYECQTDGLPNSSGEYEGFDNGTEDEVLIGGDFFHEVVEVLAMSSFLMLRIHFQKKLDLRRCWGEKILNNVWLPLTNSLDHVLNFEVNNLDVGVVKIESAGPAGIDAEVKAMTDINGVLTGLQVTNPGRYFFPGANDGTSVSVPGAYQDAQVVLPSGESVRANIIWGQNLMILVLLLLQDLN